MIITVVTTDKGSLIPIGRQGEKNARQTWFDLTYLIENFGDGTAVLVHQRSKDDAPYVISAVQENNRLLWTVDETDTAYEGFGMAEIRWTVNSTLAKTVIYKTSVDRALASQTEIPDPYESWYDKMMEQIGDNQEYAERAEAAAQDAEAAEQAVLGASVSLEPVTTNGNLTFSASLVTVAEG